MILLRLIWNLLVLVGTFVVAFGVTTFLQSVFIRWTEGLP